MFSFGLSSRRVVQYIVCLMKYALSRDFRFTFICWLAYSCAYVGRLNFNASIVPITERLAMSKADVGLIGSCFFIAYGCGQLVNAFLSKYYNTRIVFFFALLTSAFLNLLFPLVPGPMAMRVIWFLNGCAQSVLWCNIVKTLADHVSDRGLPNAIVAMSTSVAFGTCVAYGLAALFVRFGYWQGTFFAASATLAAAAVIWISIYKPAQSTTPSLALSESAIPAPVLRPRLGGAMIVLFLLICVGGIANGFLKDGLNIWVPSVLYESFDLSPSIAILLTLLLPIVSIFGAQLNRVFHEKIAAHAEMNAYLFLAVAVFSTGILVALYTQNLITILFCFSGMALCLGMINNTVTSMFVLNYRRRFTAVFTVGLAAGIINTFCYVGSASSSYLLGALAQSRGWLAVFVFMLGVAVFGLLVSILGAFHERRLLWNSP